MMVTVFADASHCPFTKAAGWGAWAKGEGWKSGITFGGPIRAQVKNSAEAEIAAMTNAIVRLYNGGQLDGATVIMLQSDCLRALQLLLMALPQARPSDHKDGAQVLPQKLNPSPLEDKALGIAREVLSECQSVLVRHVKGHREGGGRNWVNRACDSIAKKHMNAQRGGRMPQKPKKSKKRKKGQKHATG